ncbi:hypothetical protein Gbem_2999 [Citrifermentans bemidjiense Bem]|uniref:Uncharacterized protein n=1 Tax=Citrifermentans bemidjiense (strain ATCC BAA-1014 / DSM 16622 / JCM 12645 / Bem) TaxID=404380 RepID=B5E833_CITBB|nr:hypothetical protein [Citrifermentans bemidjiense]ACH40002.1 hypothetical protein Gbem_2999 [Citrifermentans bemidjiense Bem]
MTPRRRLYIPITRSGSSILASITTQMLQEGSRLRRENRPPSFSSQYPNLCLWAFIFGSFFLFILDILISSTLAMFFGDWWISEQAGWLRIAVYVFIWLVIRGYIDEKEWEYQQEIREHERQSSERMHAVFDAKRRARR